MSYTVRVEMGMFFPVVGSTADLVIFHQEERTSLFHRRALTESQTLP